jgi:hypothetical protein
MLSYLLAELATTTGYAFACTVRLILDDAELLNAKRNTPQVGERYVRHKLTLFDIDG